jgi:hypothetical protein
LKLPDSSKKTFTQYSRSDWDLPQRLAVESGPRVGNVFVVVDPPRSCWAPAA